MYISEKKKSIASLEYGQLHEGDAVASYVAAKTAEGNTLLRVEEVGIILSKERPGYGASLDRKVSKGSWHESWRSGRQMPIP